MCVDLRHIGFECFWWNKFLFYLFSLFNKELATRTASCCLALFIGDRAFYESDVKYVAALFGLPFIFSTGYHASFCQLGCRQIISINFKWCSWLKFLASYTVPCRNSSPQFVHKTCIPAGGRHYRQ